MSKYDWEYQPSKDDRVISVRVNTECGAYIEGVAKKYNMGYGTIVRKMVEDFVAREKGDE